MIIHYGKHLFVDMLYDIGQPVNSADEDFKSKKVQLNTNTTDSS
jgi:hypothetical protein